MMDIFKLFAGFSIAKLSSQVNSQNFPHEEWPNQLIRIITTDPGGVADIAARFITPTLSNFFGQPVYIDNRSGAGSITAIETGVSSVPANTPKHIIQLINQEVVKALNKSAVKQSLLKSGNDATPNPLMSSPKLLMTI